MVTRRHLDTNRWAQAFAAAEENHNFSSATLSQRRSAFERFLAVGMPVTADEDWKYTSLRGLAGFTPTIFAEQHRQMIDQLPSTGTAGRPIDRRFADPAPALAAIEANDPLRTLIGDPTWAKYIVLNGQLVPTADALQVEAKKSRKSSSQTDSEQRLPSLEDVCQTSPTDGLMWLHQAFRPEPIEVHLHHTSQRQKVLLLSLSGSFSGLNFSCSDIRVRCAEQAEADVVIAQVDLSENPTLRLDNLTLIAEPSSRLRILHVQDARKGAHLVSRMGMLLKRNASCTHVLSTTASGLIRNDLSSILAEPGADLVVNGFYSPSAGGHIDNHTDTSHEVGQTTSNQLYMGLMSTPSHAVFNGRIRILRGADGSSAHQLNRNLLLSPNAAVDTKPELQIDADDVSCSHGATIGALSEDEIFYLRSRGLTREQAHDLICNGFAAEPASTGLSEEQRRLYNSWALEAGQLF
jgi:Fe-S cluster assembly protein SufD